MKKLLILFLLAAFSQRMSASLMMAGQLTFDIQRKARQEANNLSWISSSDLDQKLLPWDKESDRTNNEEEERSTGGNESEKETDWLPWDKVKGLDLNYLATHCLFSRNKEESHNGNRIKKVENKELKKNWQSLGDTVQTLEQFSKKNADHTILIRGQVIKRSSELSDWGFFVNHYRKSVKCIRVTRYKEPSFNRDGTITIPPIYENRVSDWFYKEIPTITKSTLSNFSWFLIGTTVGSVGSIATAVFFKSMWHAALKTAAERAANNR